MTLWLPMKQVFDVAVLINVNNHLPLTHSDVLVGGSRIADTGQAIMLIISKA
jgi:hypothetical protein